eukprot:4799729-Amphidinium_carterae.1
MSCLAVTVTCSSVCHSSFDGFDLGNRRRPVELLLAGVNAGESAAEAVYTAIDWCISACSFLCLPGHRVPP